MNCATTNAAFFKRIARTAHSPPSIARSRTQLTATLVSGTQAVYTAQPKQDVVLSERHGTFMQPTSDACPVFNQHEERINFKGGPDGLTLGLQPTSSFCATENLAQQRRNSSPLYRAIFAAPVEPTPSSLAEPAAKEIPVLSAPQQLELFSRSLVLLAIRLRPPRHHPERNPQPHFSPTPPPHVSNSYTPVSEVP